MIKWAEVFGDDLNANSVSPPDLQSPSRVPQIVIREESGTFFATGQSSVIDSGTDPIAVIQTAIDLVNSWHGNRPHESGAVPFSCSGVVDCNQLELSAVGSTLTLKSGVGLRNLFIDGEGTADAFTSNSGQTDRGIWLKNVHVQNTDNGFHLQNIFMSSFEFCSAVDCESSGWRIDGFIYNHVDNCHSRNNVDHGWMMAGNGGNLNQFSNCQGHSNDSRGWSIRAGYGNLFLSCAAESNSSAGIRQENAAEENVYLFPWLEDNSGEGMSMDTGGSVIAYPTLWGDNLVLNPDADGTRIIHPMLGGNAGEEITIWGAPLVHFEGDNPDMITQEGDLMVINGWGDNDGDPNSTGAWNGNGYEGLGVVVTTNGAKYVYRGGAWV